MKISQSAVLNAAGQQSCLKPNSESLVRLADLPTCQTHGQQVLAQVDPFALAGARNTLTAETIDTVADTSITTIRNDPCPSLGKTISH
jgi:hypothetical protein